jgi:hypothetical protein
LGAHSTCLECEALVRSCLLPRARGAAGRRAGSGYLRPRWTPRRARTLGPDSSSGLLRAAGWACSRPAPCPPGLLLPYGGLEASPARLRWLAKHDRDRYVARTSTGPAPGGVDADPAHLPAGHAFAWPDSRLNEASRTSELYNCRFLWWYRQLDTRDQPAYPHAAPPKLRLHGSDDACARRRRAFGGVRLLQRAFAQVRRGAAAAAQHAARVGGSTCLLLRRAFYARSARARCSACSWRRRRRRQRRRRTPRARPSWLGRGHGCSAGAPERRRRGAQAPRRGGACSTHAGCEEREGDCVTLKPGLRNAANAGRASSPGPGKLQRVVQVAARCRP